VREHVQRLGRILRKRGDKRAVLYELVTEATTETYTSERRGSTVLTADLVNARSAARSCAWSSLDDGRRARAVTLAERLVAVVRAHVGETHDELSAAIDAVDVEAARHRLKDGLAKLLEDRCELRTRPAAVGSRGASPRRLHARERTARPRSDAGEQARPRRGPRPGRDARARHLGDGDRAWPLRRPEEARRCSPRSSAIGPEALVPATSARQAQAVLLRAVKVTSTSRWRRRGRLRALFRRSSSCGCST
jgi:hypothetical protein